MQVITKPDQLKPVLARTDTMRKRWARTAIVGAVLGLAAWLMWGDTWLLQGLTVLVGWSLLSHIEHRAQGEGMRRVLHSACPLLHGSCCAPWDMASCSVRSNRRWAAVMARHRDGSDDDGHAMLDESP